MSESDYIRDKAFEFNVKPCGHHAGMEKKVDELRKTVFGNGDPTKSLIYQIAVLNSKMTLNNWLTAFLVVTIVGGIVKGLLF